MRVPWMRFCRWSCILFSDLTGSCWTIIFFSNPTFHRATSSLSRMARISARTITIVNMYNTPPPGKKKANKKKKNLTRWRRTRRGPHQVPRLLSRPLLQTSTPTTVVIRGPPMPTLPTRQDPPIPTNNNNSKRGCYMMINIYIYDKCM